MTPESFRRWRRRMGLNKEQAAVALDVSPKTIYNYEHGAPIPRTTALACLAMIALGATDYDGPEDLESKPAQDSQD